MRAVSGRGRGDTGASMVLVALLLFSLVALAAVAVDTAALVQERRTLQNSADAAALAVAKDCAGAACGPVAATAGLYADANADDGTTAVSEICGTAPLTPCPDPPPVPAGAGYVRVTTRTRTPGGSDEVPYSLGRVLGLRGQTVHARATAVWGGPASLTSTLPVTISRCEWSTFTAGGTTYASPPPYPPYPPAGAERTIYLHDTTGATPCPQTPAGGDLPGGFGWLRTQTGCHTPSSTTGWYWDSTGVPPPSSCDPDEMEALIGTVVHVPVHDGVGGGDDGTGKPVGANATYHISGYAAFYLTGYRLTGQYREDSIVTGRPPCTGSRFCISGFFLDGQIAPPGGTIGGPSMGSTLVQLVQ